MEYPDKIYNRYEIIEKVICGQTHYGLVRIYNVFGFDIKKHKRVESNPYDDSIGRIDFEGSKWHPNKLTLHGAIDFDNRKNEYTFRKKVTK